LVDLFEEVEEELRSERYLRLLRNLAPWLTGVFALVLAAYLGYWGFKVYQDRNLNAAAASYQKGVDALGQGDQTGAFANFDAASKAGAPAYKALALMQEGNLRLEAGKSDEAAKFYDQAAAAAPNQIIGDLARLKAAEALLGTAPYAQLQTRLTPLIDTKRPYSVYAREALAMAKLMAGKTDEAKRDLTLVGLSLDAPEDMRQRSQVTLALIEAGEAPTAVAAVKAAATMPPPAPMTVAPPQPGSPGGQGAAPNSPTGAAQ
jgi:hypothetical protein